MQYYRQTTGNKPSPALVKAALINSATDMDDSVETGPAPNMDEGWGRVDLSQLIGSSRGYQFLDQSQLLTSGQTYERRIIVSSANEPLKITLAYTDVPGFPGAIPALVNDLDLEVEGPDGQVYLGNQFADGESVSGSSAADKVNNVEGVHLFDPFPGVYVVRIRARNVVRDARRDTPQTDQDFALVMSGDIPAVGTTGVFLDRPAYTAPSDIRISVLDDALAAQSTVSVTARSTSEPNPESILLRSATSGFFTGHVATALGPAASDGQLQIANNDQITVSFIDPISHQTYTASAVGDLVRPVISNVSSTNSFARVLISWETDEPANSIVRFGLSTSLGSAQTNFAYEDFHEIQLEDLRPGSTYYFLVSSIDIAGNPSTNGQLFTFVAPVPPPVLLVNAYESDDLTEIPLSTYTDTLNAAGIPYHLWDIQGGAPPPTVGDLRPYRVVIWRVSDSIGTSSTLTDSEQTAIRQYLAGGGAFLFTSMEHLSRLPASFKQDVLHVQSFREDVGVPEILGINNNPLTVGMDMVLDYDPYYTDFHEILGISADLADTLTLTGDAAPLVLSADTREIAGLTYPRIGQSSTGRVAFLAFPLDVAPASGTAPNNRATLLKNLIDFLAPGRNGIGRINFDSPSYTLPSLVTIELADSDLAGTTQAVVQVYSDLRTNRLSVVLRETIPPGLFRGSFVVVTNNSPPGTNQLWARGGDFIHTDYLDASSFTTVSTLAVIDTNAPVIRNIEVDPSYVEATITWDTSKDTDALVQFGESKFLGRTAYSSDVDTTHEVVLQGLLPDRNYYYQIVSRDVAGNTTVNDNNGEPYILRTLRPTVPPYSANFDGGPANWEVFSSDESTSTWQLGVPNNFAEHQAHSPPNAWGSCLNGANTDTIDTFLISPAIDLTGASAAHLSFWTSYDMSEQTDFDLYEVGQLLVFTNSNSDPTPLGEFYDVSGGWYEEGFDLTPFVGNVVYVVWYHTLFSFEAAPRGGWFVDDVSFTQIPLAPGLRIDRVGTNVVLSWSTNAEGYFLVSKPSAVPATSWTAVTNVPVVADERYWVTNAPSGTARFYQLMKSGGAPPLAVSSSGANVILSWPAAVTDYVLQASPALVPPQWNTLSDQPTVSGNQQSVTLNRSGTARFFRLIPR